MILCLFFVGVRSKQACSLKSGERDLLARHLCSTTVISHLWFYVVRHFTFIKEKKKEEDGNFCILDIGRLALFLPNSILIIFGLLV